MLAEAGVEGGRSVKERASDRGVDRWLCPGATSDRAGKPETQTERDQENRDPDDPRMTLDSS
ncbi:MAG: hypothetical protein DMD81_02705 [Candidatus Rokuibacteriota bacterium]|nr:MAG: hypothetical protein DMD81_02705 [Candidatus Rokubacteria bacterium]